jgi:endonuclease/exonuclease/phosphatase (EEP) superfamily protein YafD
MTPNAARRLLAILATLALVASACATVLALFARHGWVPELATHFRLQYLLLLLLLGAGFALTRRPRHALLAVALMVPNAWSVAPYLLPVVVTPSLAAPTGQDVSIVSLNLSYRNREYAAVRDYLRASRADVLVLSELTPEWVAELREITTEFPHWIAVDRSSPWGLGVFSRYPLREASTTDLGVDGSVNVVAMVAFPAGEVQLVGVHLASPTTANRATQRNGQLDRLAALLGPPRAGGTADAPPRMLVGDMNVTPYSPYFGDLLERTGMVDARRQQGPTATWPSRVMPAQIAIDHCLADPAVAIASVRRGPIVGSDHYPLEILLRNRG